MATTNLTLEQQLILLLTDSYIKKYHFESLNSNDIGNIRYLAKELSKGMEQPEEKKKEKTPYPPFENWMSEKTIRRLNNKDVYTPEELAEHDFEDKHLYGFVSNIELLQYAMVAGIKLKNYRY